jgi:hypothetical protein
LSIFLAERPSNAISAWSNAMDKGVAKDVPPRASGCRFGAASAL